MVSSGSSPNFILTLYFKRPPSCGYHPCCAANAATAQSVSAEVLIVMRVLRATGYHCWLVAYRSKFVGVEGPAPSRSRLGMGVLFTEPRPSATGFRSGRPPPYGRGSESVMYAIGRWLTRDHRERAGGFFPGPSASCRRVPALTLGAAIHRKSHDQKIFARP